MSSREGLKVFAVVCAVAALSTYQVMGGARKKAGHDLLSSEKPQALRGETEGRTLAGEKAKQAESRARKAAEAAKAQ